MEDLDVRIDRGIEFLDATYGKGKYKKVKAEDLNMASVFDDIVGLTAGSPNLMSYDPVELGDMLDRGFMPAASETWDDINEAWKARLN